MTSYFWWWITNFPSKTSFLRGLGLNYSFSIYQSSCTSVDSILCLKLVLLSFGLYGFVIDRWVDLYGELSFESQNRALETIFAKDSNSLSEFCT